MARKALLAPCSLVFIVATPGSVHEQMASSVVNSLALKYWRTNPVVPASSAVTIDLPGPSKPSIAKLA